MNNVHVISPNLMEETNSLYNHLINMKTKFKCTLDFKINSNNEFVVALNLPSGYIIQLFLIRPKIQTDSLDDTINQDIVAVQIH